MNASTDPASGEWFASSTFVSTLRLTIRSCAVSLWDTMFTFVFEGTAMSAADDPASNFCACAEGAKIIKTVRKDKNKFSVFIPIKKDPKAFQRLAKNLRI